MIELFVQAIWPRRAGGRLLTLWHIFEPTLLMLVLLAGAAAFGWTLPYERSTALFVAACVVVVMFLRAVREVEVAVAVSVSATRLATVSIFDRPIATALVRGALAVPGAGLGLALTWIIDQVAIWPSDLPAIAVALAATVVLGFGVGLALGAAAMPRIWGGLAWVALIVVMVFGTGLVYLPSGVPVWLRDLLGLNPVLHAVELFRIGTLGTYPSAVFSGGYLAIWCLAAPVIGIGLFWSRRDVLLR